MRAYVSVLLVVLFFTPAAYAGGVFTVDMDSRPTSVYVGNPTGVTQESLSEVHIDVVSVWLRSWLRGWYVGNR